MERIKNATNLRGMLAECSIEKGFVIPGLQVRD